MFGERLREARMNRKITQQSLADHICVTLRNYQRYEQGIREPAYAILVKLADILDVSTDYLLGRDEFIAKHREN